MGAGAGTGKSTVKQLPVAGSFLEPEPVIEIYKNGSKEPGAMSFSVGAGEKRYRLPNSDNHT